MPGRVFICTLSAGREDIFLKFTPLIPYRWMFHVSGFGPSPRRSGYGRPGGCQGLLFSET